MTILVNNQQGFVLFDYIEIKLQFANNPKQDHHLYQNNYESEHL